MTVVTRATNPSLDANQARQVAAGDLYAGEALLAVAPCYIKASDGKAYMSDGVADAEAGKFVGFTPKAYVIGEPVTLYGAGTRFRYGSAMTPGDIFYIKDGDAYTSAGYLDDLPTLGDPNGTAIALTSTDILVTRVYPDSGLYT